MSKPTVAEYMDQLEEAGQALLEALTDLEDVELTYATDSPRFFTVRRTLLLASTHVQEHTTQLEAARADAGVSPTMAQRMLGRMLKAHGELMAAMVGLDEAGLDAIPAEGEWSPRQAIEHSIQVQAGLLKRIQEAREKAEVSEKQ